MSDTLHSVYQQLASGDTDGFQKTAAANPEITKLAQHYDGVGRSMARGMFQETLKQAMAEGGEDEGAPAGGEGGEGGEGAEEDQVAKRKAEILAELKRKQMEGEGEPQA